MTRLQIILGSTAMLALFAAFSAPAVSQEASKAPKEGAMEKPSPEEKKEMMEKWNRTRAPGKEHERLNHFVGEWDIVIRIWWGGPGTPPLEAKGTSSVKWVMDKRFIMEEVKSEMCCPDETGQMQTILFEGLGISGYDRYQNVYKGTWVDNQVTHMLTMTGGCDPSGKKFTSYGKMDEPMLDVSGRMVKYVTTIKDADTHLFESFDLHARDDYKVMEIEYKRKK